MAILIAADDAPALVKARADVVCSGTNDQAGFAAAFGYGDTVEASEGTFWLSAPIVMNGGGKSLRGSGPNTVLRFAPNLAGGDMEGIYGSVRGTSISDLTIDGDRENQSSSHVHYGIWLNENNLNWTPKMQGCVISNVTLLRIGTCGVYWVKANNSVLSNVHCRDVGNFGGAMAALHLHNSHYNAIHGCVVSDASIGLRLVGSSRNAVGASIFRQIDDEGVIFDGEGCYENVLAGCVIAHAGGPNVRLQAGAARNLVNGDMITEASQDANEAQPSVLVEANGNNLSQCLITPGLTANQPSEAIFENGYSLAYNQNDVRS